MMRALRSPFLALSLLLMALLVIPTGGARAQEREIDIETFHQELDRYGRWFAHPTHGYVWSPDVDDDWRPYSRGQWVFTDEHGWYWQSEEPFGWAVFHYGRWFLDSDAGWVWVPGTEWAPAWVAWRHSDEQVGWAPLPPEAEWRGDHLNFSQRYYDAPRYTAAWCFVPVALLTSVAVYRHIAHPSRNVSFVRQTAWVPSHRSVDRRIFNVGFDRYRYERITRRPVTPLRIVDVPRHQDYGRRAGLGRGNELQVYRPRFSAPAAVRPPPRLVEPPRRDNPGFGRPSGGPGGGWPRPGNPRDQQRDAGPKPPAGTPANPDVQRRRPWEARPPQQQQQQQPATIPPPQRQVTPPPTVPPPQQPANVPPPQRQLVPPPQQPANVPPPQRQFVPPPQQPANVPPQQRQFVPPPQQPANVPPPQQPATIPPPRQPPAPPPVTRGQPPPQQGAGQPPGRGQGQGGPGGQQGGQQPPAKGGQGEARKRPPQPGEKQDGQRPAGPATN
ncbi:MAG: DUF6600 domain-containing protein [Hyphomicrobiaceae bacterium]